MRWMSLLALGLLLAGCSDSPAAESPAGQDAASMALPALPADFAVNETMPPSLDQTAPISLPGETICDDPTMVCHHYAIELPRAAVITVHLRWVAGPNDLDLFLLQDGAIEAQSNFPLGTAYAEFIRQAVPAGSHDLVVEGFTSTASPLEQAAGTPYSLAVWFDEP